MAKQMHYVSEFDQLIQQFDKQHPGLSRSQQREVAKARRIAALRDNADPVDQSLSRCGKDFK